MDSLQDCVRCLHHASILPYRDPAFFVHLFDSISSIASYRFPPRVIKWLELTEKLAKKFELLHENR